MHPYVSHFLCSTVLLGAFGCLGLCWCRAKCCLVWRNGTLAAKLADVIILHFTMQQCSVLQDLTCYLQAKARAEVFRLCESIQISDSDSLATIWIPVVLFRCFLPPETQYGSCESWNRKRLLSVCSWYRSMFLADNSSMKCSVSLEQIPELQLLPLKPASKH